ncbi:GspH/FimT family pseudopilin [Neptuniibacter sp. SY11_33]|uniref:GspH/FimT family pseudopilin n=1 Tax=Neptuniibacter sp. SY11_33 TaxID=3398215 RepID=UPI0039F5BEA7
MLLREKGFSLLELIFTVVVLVVLLGIGIPSFNSFVQSSRLRAVTHDLTSALQLARSEALSQRGTVAVCRANVAMTACDFDADWSSGWIVVSQTGTDLEDAADVDPVRVWDEVSLTVSGAVTGFVFDRQGQGTAAAIRIQNDTDHRCLSTNVSGRVAVREIASVDSCP